MRSASKASTESVTVGALAPKTENDDNRQVATQKKFLTLEREPILPPDCRIAQQQCNQQSCKIEPYVRMSVRIYQPATCSFAGPVRSEERRVGKECRSRW